MTPAARIAAAIPLLDEIIGGTAAEKALTGWARRSRFAGSGDRSAVRDLVFDALRCRRSFGWLGGGDTGRGLMIGALRAQQIEPAAVFTGEGYGPEPLNEAEIATRDLTDAPAAVRVDIPDWLFESFNQSLGEDLLPVLSLMRDRAPVFLRVNLAVATRDEAAALLLTEGIETAPHSLSPSALVALTNPRKIQTSNAYLGGTVELQDVASQAVVDALEIPKGARVLDYCAGGGGKALAIAARPDAQVFAHDVDPARMRDIPIRAGRSGVEITILDTQAVARADPFDLVLCDVPCSGSGAWRRAPDAKWRLTPDRLAEMVKMQREILHQCSPMVGPNGTLAYATCSMLCEENHLQIAEFIKENLVWGETSQKRLTPLDGGDGFFISQLRRMNNHL